MLIIVISPRIRPRQDRCSKLMSQYVPMGNMPVPTELACPLFYFVMVIQVSEILIYQLLGPCELTLLDAGFLRVLSHAPGISAVGP